MVIKIVMLFGLMFLLMLIGAPIAVSLGVATMATMVATTNIGLTSMATACFSGLDSFPLMAIPFFMLAGNLMKSGGISRRILDFADALVGWVTGSVGMVTVVASMFFAALSGSSPATVTAIGGITIPEMKKEGYDPAYATAISAASVLAKTYRDMLMEHLERRHPGYGFARHKGYGTADHYEALHRLGPCRQHRLTFRGVLPDRDEGPGTRQGSLL